MKIKEPPTIWARGREKMGKATGGERRCQMEGCNGRRIIVRWSDGTMTHPCTKGMAWSEEKNEWEIL